ncbi:MAG TPA: hypothetical protein VGI64_01920 [Streptosporangiaceae bacterium]
MLIVSVVLLLAAAAILVGVVAAALGRGGELGHFAADSSAPDDRQLSPADIALSRPPPALFGYSQRITDELLGAAARTVAERDMEIARLRRQLAELRGQAGEQAAASPPPGSAPVTGPPWQFGLSAGRQAPSPDQGDPAGPPAAQQPMAGRQAALRRSLPSRRAAAAESGASRPGRPAADNPVDIWRPRSRTPDE